MSKYMYKKPIYIYIYIYNYVIYIHIYTDINICTNKLVTSSAETVIFE